MKKFSLIAFLLGLFFVFTPTYGLENSTDLYIEGAKLAGEGNYEEAKIVFQKVIAESPYYALAHYGIGKVYMYKGGNLEIAIRELKMAVSLDKRLARAHFYLGMAYYLNRDYAYAVTSFYTAYQLDDRYLEALYNIGSIYDYMGHPNKSLLFYKKYVDQKKMEEEYFNY